MHGAPACVHSLLGEKDKARDLPEPWSRRVNGVTKNWLNNDSDFEVGDWLLQLQHVGGMGAPEQRVDEDAETAGVRREA